jgi:hypothetical protein
MASTISPRGVRNATPGRRPRTTSLLHARKHSGGRNEKSPGAGQTAWAWWSRPTGWVGKALLCDVEARLQNLVQWPYGKPPFVGSWLMGVERASSVTQLLAAAGQGDAAALNPDLLTCGAPKMTPSGANAQRSVGGNAGIAAVAPVFP